jgi:SNF2 family DNA or RNA helicase
MEQIKPLWEHQIAGIEKAKSLGGMGIFNCPGTGKSRMVIDILRGKYMDAGRVLRTLIFAPPIVLDNWANEWAKYSRIPRSQVRVLHGSGKERLKKFQEGSALIYVTNYEAMQMEALYAAIQEWKPEAIVFDECHRLANYKAKRSKLADALANPGTKKDPRPRPLVYMLSGTPVMNSMLDIFHQYKILDGGETFGANFFAFRAKYFRDKNAFMNRQNYFPNWVPVQGADEEIAKLMARNSMRVKKEACLDLPPLVDQTIEVDMSQTQAAAYKSMLKDYVAFFEKDGQQHASMAQLAITKGLRLMQIASGYVKTDEGAELALDDGFTPKQEALHQVLEDLVQHHKVIIWANWKHNYKQIREVLDKLGVKYLEMNGDYGPKKNRENAALFESDHSYRCIIGHPESAGEGINLISASYSVSYSRDFSWRRFVQASARNHRGGSEIHEKVTRIILVTKNTIEGEITRKLAAKEEISESVLREITLKRPLERE